MNKEMKELVQKTLGQAKKAGADDCFVKFSRTRFVEIAYRDRKPETIKEATSQNLTVGIFKDHRYSVSSTPDLRPATLETFIQNAVATTLLLAEDPYRSPTDPKYYEGRSDIDLDLLDPNYSDFSADDRNSLVKTIEDSCLKNGGNKVISVTAGCYDSKDESVSMSSNGFEGSKEETSFWAGADMTIQDAGDRRPNNWYWIGGSKKAALANPEAIGQETARRTLALLGSKKIDTQTLPIIIENRVTASFIDKFISPLFGRNIQQKRSFLADKKGQKIGNELFTLYDEPLIVGGLGSRLFDSDGISSKKRIIVDKGVLKEFFVDWYYSRKLGWEPTTGSTSNLVIPPGTRSVKQIMKDLGKGIYITGFLGGNSNGTTGDFSVGINGQYFENGEIVHPVSEMNIADNQLKLWPKLVELADDPWLYSSNRLPSMVIDKVVVAGK